MKKNKPRSRRRQVARHLPGRRKPGGKRLKIAPESLKRFTRRNWAISLEERVRRLSTYLRGWRGYFGYCETPSVLRDLHSWIRRRLRWVQWKVYQRRKAELIRLGVDAELAQTTPWSPKGPWRLSHTPGVRIALNTIILTVAVVLVGLILIQRGKGADAGAAFGGDRKANIDGGRPGVNKVSYATDDGYVAKTEYEKLRREVESLKGQMQRLLEALSARPASKPAAAEPAPPKSKPTAAEVKGEKKPVPSAPPPSQERVGRADQEEFAAEKGDRRKEAAEAKRELDQFLRAQKLLFKPGEIQLEFGASYAQDTETNRVNPLGPVFVVRSASANFLMRYGLAEDLEFDFAVPLVYTELERDIRPFSQIQVGTTLFPSFTREADVGLGDIDWGLRYAALHEEGALPEVTLNVNAKSDTGDVDRLLGTGHWNVGAGVSLVKTIDPVVLFGSLGYTWTLEEEDIDPGDQIPYSIGMGFSLNDRVSFSMVMGGAAIRRTEVNGAAISGSGLDVNSLQFTTTVQLAKRVFLEPVVGFGLTDDAADFMVGINVPFGLEGRFPLPFFHNL